MIHIKKDHVRMWIIADAYDYHSVYLVIKCALRHSGGDKFVINMALGFGLCFGLQPLPLSNSMR